MQFKCYFLTKILIYFFQSIDCSVYSIINPEIRINKNNNDEITMILFRKNIIKISGIRRVISISKIKKISLIIKNWILKGRRELEIGSNPHSKGEIFSRDLSDFREMAKLIIRISLDRLMKSIERYRIDKIIYIKYNLNFLIGN